VAGAFFAAAAPAELADVADAGPDAQAPTEDGTTDPGTADASTAGSSNEEKA
jgi:large subunit ribosomal protein L4